MSKHPSLSSPSAGHWHAGTCAVLLAVAAAVTSVPSFAALYKCKSSGGHYIYSDRPCSRASAGAKPATEAASAPDSMPEFPSPPIPEKRKPSVPKYKPTPAQSPAKARPSPDPTSVYSAALRAGSAWIALFALGGFLCTAGWIGLIISAFAARYFVFAFGMIFFPLLGLIYVMINWQGSRIGSTLFLSGIVSMGLGAYSLYSNLGAILVSSAG